MISSPLTTVKTRPPRHSSANGPRTVAFATSFATKYTSNYKRGQAIKMVNYSGNNTKSLHVSVEASLKKLRTAYIDILYVHWWDYTTSVEEVMNSLHVLVQQGKVLYLVCVYFLALNVVVDLPSGYL